MRRLLAVALIMVTVGCHKTGPTLAHGKPVGDWVAALCDPDARARKKAAGVLGNVGAIDPAVVPALAGAVRDREPAVRAEAVLALAKIGPAARDAEAALAEAQKDPNPTV
ncbi:MAG TPA: HEAT repeat domain-containing protein, partial [Gemmataceae bacterium]|nr:HEAT repeat domain-containing protein [Gemmataceae bacterium]